MIGGKDSESLAHVGGLCVGPTELRPGPMIAVNHDDRGRPWPTEESIHHLLESGGDKLDLPAIAGNVIGGSANKRVAVVEDHRTGQDGFVAAVGRHHEWR